MIRTWAVELGTLLDLCTGPQSYPQGLVSPQSLTLLPDLGDSLPMLCLVILGPR